MHEYHVDVKQNDGSTIAYRVDIEDENHHSKWDETWKFFAHLSSLIGVSSGAVLAYKWIRKH
jgi:hypothetical protein